MGPDDPQINLARSLHDGLAQEMVGLGYRVDLLLSDGDIHGDSRAQLRALRGEITRITTSIRDEIYQLREPAVESFSDFLIHESRSFKNQITVDSTENALRLIAKYEDLEFELRFIAAELLRNAITHAGASAIAITISLDQTHLNLIIDDNGNGETRERAGHFGLPGLRERARSLQGELAFSLDNGTRAWLRIPVTKYL